MATNPTYIGYAERSAESQVNWAEIGIQVSDMLGTEAKIREEKKQKIDEATVAYQEALLEAPKGQSDQWNQKTSDFVDLAQNQMLMANRLLKSGQMKMKDYLNMRQGLTSNTAKVFDTAQKVQEYVKKHMERLEAGDASAAEALKMERVSAFANMKDAEFAIEPISGVVSVRKKIAEKDENGDVKKDKDGNTVYKKDEKTGQFVYETQSISQLEEGLNTFVNRFDVDGELSKMEEQLGEVTVSEIRNIPGTKFRYIENTIGKIADGRDVRDIDPEELNEDEKIVFSYLKFEEEYVKGIMTNSAHTLSILTDFVEGDFKLKYDCGGKPEEAGTICVDQSQGFDQYNFSEADEKKAIEFLKNRFRSKIDKKVTKGGIVEERETAQERADAQASATAQASPAKSSLTTWLEVGKAKTLEEKNRLIGSLLNDDYVKDKGIIDLYFQMIDDKLHLSVRTEGGKNDDDFFIPENATTGQWLQASSGLTGVSSLSGALEMAGLTEGEAEGISIYSDPTMLTDVKASKRGGVNRTAEVVNKWLSQSTGGLPVEKMTSDEDKLIDAIGGTLNSIGLQVFAPTDNQNMIVIYPEGASKNSTKDRVEIFLDGKSNGEIHTELMQAIQRKMSAEVADVLYDKHIRTKPVGKKDDESKESESDETGGNAR